MAQLYAAFSENLNGRGFFFFAFLSKSKDYDVLGCYSRTTQQDTSTTWENGPFVTHKEVTLLLH
jgi:hypothetical protein